MFEILFLGTSASAPSIHRGLTANIILAGEHRFLLDCGEGTQRQILKSGVGFKRLDKILLTHSHLDHILGLGGLVSTFTRWEDGIGDIEIWGGSATLKRVHALLFDVVLRDERSQMQINLNPLQEGPFFSSKQFEISAFPVFHRGAGCYGFVFKEHDHHPFLAEKAEALGVPVGPERGRLVKGERVTLADGRVITPDMVLGEREQGCKFVYVGDTGRTDNILPHAQDADTLVIEATFLDSEREDAGSFGHLTAKQAAELARDANVKTLILNHVSRRYRERDIIREAQAVFPNTFVARDFDHFQMRRGTPTTKIQPESSQTQNDLKDSI